MGAKVKRDWCSECNNKKNGMQHREIIIPNSDSMEKNPSYFFVIPLEFGTT